MSRIRSIHPGILTDEAFMTLTVECPLAIAVLVGVWMHADDSGVFEWKPIKLKASILPGVNTDMGLLLEELVRNSFVRCFEVDGRKYGVVRNFVVYQRPKSAKDVHPASPEMRDYAGFENGKRPRAETGRPPSEDSSEPLPNYFGTSSGISPQMEDEGGRVEIINNLPSPTISQGEGDLKGFEEFWELFPKGEFVSKPKASAAYADLTPAERIQAIAAIPALRARKPTTNPLSPARARRTGSLSRLEALPGR